jgi:hypothetical protein
MQAHRPAISILCAALWACTSWQSEPVAPAQLVASDDAQRVRVTRTDGSQVVLEDARVAADGVHGQWERTQAFIPTTEVRQLQVRREDQAGTVGLIVGVLGVAGLTATLLTEGGEPQVSFARTGARGSGCP